MKKEDLLTLGDLTGTYEVILADPPWPYPKSCMFGPDNTINANKHYNTMTLDQIYNLPVQNFAAKDSVLFLWTTGPHLANAFSVIKSWGFEYASVAFVWHKQKVLLGFYTMSSCEYCLVARRGSALDLATKSTQQFLSCPSGDHSRKPTEFHNRITLMYPTQRKLELFARGSTHGWSTWGNEKELFDVVDRTLIEY